jgi:hypothetical protein
MQNILNKEAFEPLILSAPFVERAVHLLTCKFIPVKILIPLDLHQPSFLHDLSKETHSKQPSASGDPGNILSIKIRH